MIIRAMTAAISGTALVLVTLTGCASGPQTDPVFRDDAPVAPKGGQSSSPQTSSQTPPRSAPTPKGNKLTGKGLYNQMSDLSYSGCYPDGSTFAETTLANGQVRDDQQNGAITGTWSVSGDALCYAHDGAEETCVNTYKDANGLHFYLVGGGAYVASTVCPMTDDAATPPTAPPPSQPSGQSGVDFKGPKITGQALYNTMSGASIEGCYPDGSGFRETTLADGRTRDDNSGNIIGSWSVSGDRLCYQNDGQAADTCVNVSQDKTGLHFYLIDSGQYIASTACPMK